MFIGLLALQESESLTKIRVCPGTHEDFQRKLEFLHEVQLNKYQYFVGHPHLVHSGCSSIEYNLRLHFYHGYPPEIADLTDHIDEVDFKENFIFDRALQAREATKQSSRAAKIRRNKRRKLGLG
jgi:hypothetical protein